VNSARKNQTLITLDNNYAIFDRTAGTALAFELGGHKFQFIAVKWNIPIENVSLFIQKSSIPGDLPEIKTFIISCIARRAGDTLQFAVQEGQVIHKFTLTRSIYPYGTNILNTLHIKWFTAFIPHLTIRDSDGDNPSRTSEGCLICHIININRRRTLGKGL
jgi:hypothetical protein